MCSITMRGASARTAGAPASASITKRGNGARTAGAPASASITGRGAPAKTAAASVSANITSAGANARTAGACRCFDVASNARNDTRCPSSRAVLQRTRHICHSSTMVSEQDSMQVSTPIFFQYRQFQHVQDLSMQVHNRTIVLRSLLYMCLSCNQ